MDRIRAISLSIGEAALLERVRNQDSRLHRFVIENGRFPHERTITLTPEQAEEFRERLTVQLAVSGFDQDYKLTKEGQIIEDLIDRFYFKETSRPPRDA